MRGRACGPLLCPAPPHGFPECVSMQIELGGVGPDDIGKGEQIIIKRAISSSTGISTENMYNLDFTDVSTSSRRTLFTFEPDASCGPGGCETLNSTSKQSDITGLDLGTGEKTLVSQRRLLSTTSNATLISFDVIYDLLMTNYSRAGQLSQALANVVRSAVDSGDLVAAIASLSASAGNTMLSSATLSASFVDSSFTTTDVDAVTFAPTALYGYCPPLYMSPNQLAVYMVRVLCFDRRTNRYGWGGIRWGVYEALFDDSF